MKGGPKNRLHLRTEKGGLVFQKLETVEGKGEFPRNSGGRGGDNPEDTSSGPLTQYRESPGPVSRKARLGAKTAGASGGCLAHKGSIEKTLLSVSVHDSLNSLPNGSRALGANTAGAWHSALGERGQQACPSSGGKAGKPNKAKQAHW